MEYSERGKRLSRREKLEGRGEGEGLISFSENLQSSTLVDINIVFHTEMKWLDSYPFTHYQ